MTVSAMFFDSMQNIRASRLGRLLYSDTIHSCQGEQAYMLRGTRPGMAFGRVFPLMTDRRSPVNGNFGCINVGVQMRRKTRVLKK